MWRCMYMPRDDMCVRVCVCARVRVCLRVSDLWVKHPLWIFANPLYMHFFYMHEIN